MCSFSHDALWKWSQKAEKIPIKSGGEVCIKSETRLCRCNLLPSVSPAVYYLAVVVRLCALLAHMRLGSQAWHTLHGKKKPKKKQVMAQHWWVFSLLSLQICGSSRCCGLSGQCLWQQITHKPFSCLRLPLVTSCKSPQTKTKASTAAFLNVKAELLGFTPPLWAFITTSFFFVLSVVVKVAQENARVRINSGASICLAKMSRHKLVWQEW